MIIDIHAHVASYKIYPSPFITGMMHQPVHSDKELSMLEPSQILRFSKMFLNDETGSNLVHQMDLAGIHKTVLLIIDGGWALGEAELSIEDIFECHYNILKKYAERIIVFGGVDPRRGENAYELFKKGVFDFGFKGLKLYPPMGYTMYGDHLNKYFQLCSDYNLPVLIHTGPSHSFLQNELADPKYIYEAARKYPQVPFILAHAGYALQSPSVQLVAALPNIYMDISGFNKHFKLINEDTVQTLGKIFHPSVNHQILFGTDWPLFNLFTPLKKQVDFIYDLYEEVRKDYTKDALDNIMFRNALSVLQVNEEG